MYRVGLLYSEFEIGIDEASIFDQKFNEIWYQASSLTIRKLKISPSTN